jgi:hypothetical protein
VGTGVVSILASGICPTGATLTGARLMEGKEEGVCSADEAAGGFVPAATFCDVVTVVNGVGLAPTVPSATQSVNVRGVVRRWQRTGQRKRRLRVPLHLGRCCRHFLSLLKHLKSCEQQLFASRHPRILYSMRVFQPLTLNLSLRPEIVTTAYAGIKHFHHWPRFISTAEIWPGHGKLRCGEYRDSWPPR